MVPFHRPTLDLDVGAAGVSDSDEAGSLPSTTVRAPMMLPLRLQPRTLAKASSNRFCRCTSLFNFFTFTVDLARVEISSVCFFGGVLWGRLGCDGFFAFGVEGPDSVSEAAPSTSDSASFLADEPLSTVFTLCTHLFTC